jgi:hypothetical protein
MPPPVYTALLAEGNLSDGSLSLGGPPSGYRWIIRDINVVCQQDIAAPTSGDLFQIYDSAEVIIFVVPSWLAVSQAVYRWEGRQVVDNPQTLHALSTGQLFSYRITGYVLTLP